MTLLELNDKIESSQKTKIEPVHYTQNDLELFNKTINTSVTIKAAYDQTDDANSFFAKFPDVRKIVGSKVCVECFYACKLGYYMQGIPTKLVYIVDKIFKEYDKEYVNVAMNAAIPLLSPYAISEFDYVGESYTLKDVIENFVGRSITLLTTSVPKVKVKDAWEVYIPTTKRVAILPDDIGSAISLDDCEKLDYDKDAGLVLQGIPLRTMGDRLGVTLSDYDLRQCV